MRPIPVDTIPSHVYLSQEDQATIFGVGQPMTIFAEHSQSGQLVYEETVDVRGGLKRMLPLRVMGPNWKRSHIVVTPTEAVYLGLSIPEESKTGEIQIAEKCTLVGPKGEVTLEKSIVIPQPHLLCSPDEAEKMHIAHGDIVTMETISEKSSQISNVVVRVHPTYRLRLEVHQDYARELWITRPVHARLI